MMMMLISKKIMMKQPKHFPFSKTNICPCSQQTFYLAERTRETEARQLWVVGRSEVGRCLVGSGRWVVGGRLPQRWGRAGEVSSKQTHNYSYSCVCLSSLLCALQTKLPILTHRPPLLLRLYPPPLLAPSPVGYCYYTCTQHSFVSSLSLPRLSTAHVQLYA